MQTPKARTPSVEVPQRKSPITPRTARQLKTTASDSDSVSSPHPTSKTPKDRSPKVLERKSPHSPVPELQKKRPSKLSELESQLAKLQDDLKKANDQLSSSETLKRQAQLESEEAKKHLLAMTGQLEESQQQLLEVTASEEGRVQEHSKISQDKDRAWQSELEAVQKQHSIDSTALASAINEIQRLKVQLESFTEAEATQSKHAESAQAEIHGLSVELAETLCVVENLKSELSNCKESKARSIDTLRKTQIQLETENAAIEMLQADGFKSTEAYKSLSLELEQSKSQVKSMEGLIRKFQSDLTSSRSKSLEEPTINANPVQENGEGNEEMKKLKAELAFMRSEVDQLKSALDAAEIRYQEDYVQSTLQIRSAYEQLERTKLELKNAEAHTEQLRLHLMDKDSQLQQMAEEKKEFNLKTERNISSEIESDMTELKTRLLDKETELQSVTEENETLKIEIKKREMESNRIKEETVALAEEARAGEQEALMKLGYITEEADKSSRRAARATEQLDAAQTANSELEAELRKLKVQADQWRKAAEAAASMLSPGKNGKFVERTVSLDSNYPLGSPYLEDLDDDSPKKKNVNNMLKKIGVLWKKNQK